MKPAVSQDYSNIYLSNQNGAKELSNHMLCPTCSKQLIQQQKGLFVCPNEDGTLVTGKYLSDIKETPTPTEIKNKVHTDSKHEIACPHCTEIMHKVNYNNTDILIDSCISCHYRWLDSGEITKVKLFKPNIEASDLLFIADVDEQIRQANKRKIKEANPRLPLQGSYRAGAEGLAAISGDHRGRLGAIAGQGLFGVFKGLLHSKTSRTLTLVTLLVLGLILLHIFWDYRDIIRSLY